MSPERSLVGNVGFCGGNNIVSSFQGLSVSAIVAKRCPSPISLSNVALVMVLDFDLDCRVVCNVELNGMMMVCCRIVATVIAATPTE